MSYLKHINQADLEDVATAYYVRVQTLERLIRALLADLEMDRTVPCPVCQAHLRYQMHEQSCSLAILATMLDGDA
jgi:hypothetical protein